MQPFGLGFFRHGEYVRYEGDNFDEEEMVDWLTDPNVMEVTDRIERVNRKMLEKLMARNEYLGVVFCECWKDGSSSVVFGSPLLCWICLLLARYLVIF